MLDVSWYIMISIVCLEKNKELELGVPPCYHRKSSCCGYSHHPWRMRHDSGWQREVAQVARLVRRSSFNSWQVVAYASILSFYLVVIFSSSFQLVHLFLFSCLKCNLVDTFIWLCLNTDHSPNFWPGEFDDESVGLRRFVACFIYLVVRRGQGLVSHGYPHSL